MAKLKCVKHGNRIMFFHDEGQDLKIVHRFDGSACDTIVVKIDGTPYGRDELPTLQTARRSR